MIAAAQHTNPNPISSRQLANHHRYNNIIIALFFSLPPMTSLPSSFCNAFLPPPRGHDGIILKNSVTINNNQHPPWIRSITF